VKERPPPKALLAAQCLFEQPYFRVHQFLHQNGETKSLENATCPRAPGGHFRFNNALLDFLDVGFRGFGSHPCRLASNQLPRSVLERLASADFEGALAKARQSLPMAMP
jgi:hypothetical protein